MVSRAIACVVVGVVLATPLSSSSHEILNPELVRRLMGEIALACFLSSGSKRIKSRSACRNGIADSTTISPHSANI